MCNCWKLSNINKKKRKTAKNFLVQKKTNVNNHYRSFELRCSLILFFTSRSLLLSFYIHFPFILYPLCIHLPLSYLWMLLRSHWLRNAPSSLVVSPLPLTESKSQPIKSTQRQYSVIKDLYARCLLIGYGIFVHLK